MKTKNAVLRLMWKEFRLQRAFLVCMALLGVLLQLLGVFVRNSSDDRLSWLFGVAFGLTALYALGCGATMFAGEQEAGTFDFQRAFPVSSKRFFWSNIGFGLASIATILIVLSITGVLFSAILAWVDRVPLGSMPEGMGNILGKFWGVAIIELFAWSVLFSLLLKRPLLAAMLAIGFASAAAQFAARTNSLDMAPYANAAYLRLAAALVVSLVALLLGLRWFRLEGMFRRSMKAKPTSAAVAYTAKSPGRIAVFVRIALRLVWQQFRESVWMWCAIVAVTCYLVYLCLSITQGISRETWVGIRGWHSLFLITAIPLLGVYAFYPDQRGAMYRFYSERGVKAGRFWLSRQTAGLAFTFALGVVLYFVVVVPCNMRMFFFFSEGDTHFPDWVRVRDYSFFIADFILLFYYLFLFFSVGQCAAMFLRSGILAAVLSIVVSGLLFVWVSAMHFWGVPWYWSIAPWPLLFLLATRWRTTAWLLERRGFRAWVWPMLTVVPMTAMVAAMPFYRVYSVPDVDPGFSPENFRQVVKATPAALETVTMYEKAFEIFDENHGCLNPPISNEPRSEDALSPEPPPTPPPVAWKLPGGLAEWQLKGLEAVRPALEILLVASKRPECARDVERLRRRKKYTGEYAFQIPNALIWQARKLESEGKLDEAWDYYLGLIRYRNHLTQMIPDEGESWGWSVNQSEMFAAMQGWAARPGQTKERLLGAFRQLQATPEDTDFVAYNFKTRYLEVRGILSGDPKYVDNVDSNVSKSDYYKRQINEYVVWERVCPWERYRALRLLNVLNRENLRYTEFKTQQLKDEECAGSIWEDYSYESPFQLKNEIHLPPQIRVNLGNNQNLSQLVDRFAEYRAAMLSMALAAWKLEHGAYPDSLDVLVGEYFEKLPIDPYTGKPFHYLAKGRPTDVKNVAAWGRYGSRVYLPANTAFLWSPGENVLDGDPVKSGGLQYRNYVGDGWSHTRNEDEAWSRVHLFPLP